MRTDREPRAPQHHYSVCGLTVASALVVPGWLRAEAARDAPDLRICRTAALPAMLEQASARGPTWSVAGERILLDVPGIARMLMTGGNEIAVAIAAGVDDADAAAFLQGSAMSVLLHQRGQMALRASAVEAGGRAVLLCGPPGAGKSTLAAALGARGHGFFSDDLCRLHSDALGTAIVSPDGGTHRLWEGAIASLGLGASQGAPVRPAFRKFHVTPARIAHRPSLPILAIYMLRDDDPSSPPGIVPLPVGEAAMLLRRNAPCFQLAAQTDGSRPLFEQATALQRQVPLFGLSRRMAFDTLPDIVARLETHWDALTAARDKA